MSMRRFTRLTNAFSKKFENLQAAVALHFAHYNLVRLHKTFGKVVLTSMPIYPPPLQGGGVIIMSGPMAPPANRPDTARGIIRPRPAGIMR
jgi:hypothetical protein